MIPKEETVLVSKQDSTWGHTMGWVQKKSQDEIKGMEKEGRKGKWKKKGKNEWKEKGRKTKNICSVQ